MNQINTQLEIAIKHHQSGEIEIARQVYTTILEREPSNHQALHLLGILSAQTGSLQLAEKTITKACQIFPKNEHYQYNLGNVKRDLGNSAQAIEAYSRAIKVNANYSQAYFARGNVYLDKKDYEKGILNFKKAVQINSKYIEALNNLGNCYEKNNQLELALAQYESILKMESDNQGALVNKGNILIALKKYDEAIICFDWAIKNNKEDANAYLNKGIALYKLKQYQDALICYAEALKLKPALHEAYNSIGQVLMDAGDYEAAKINFEKCIEIKPDYIEGNLNLAALYVINNNIASALKLIEGLILNNPLNIELYINKGIIYHLIKNFKEAENCHQYAYEINPKNVKNLYYWANNYFEKKEYKKSIDIYKNIYKLDADYENFLGAYLHAKISICDWSDLNTLTEKLFKKINSKELIPNSFPILALTDDTLIQKQAAEILVENQYSDKPILGPIQRINKNKKIKIAYISGDFQEHPVSYLTVKLFELHSREDFEIIGISLANSKEDEMRKRLNKSFDKFIDCSNKSDIEIAKNLREMGIDIAINLSGYTSNGRPNIFSFRVAPIQINYLGYPGTLGAKYIDYIVADEFLIQTEELQNYVEKIIYLPNSFMPSDGDRCILNLEITRKQFNLPQDGIVFCCFNQAYKINSLVMNSWIRILKKIDGSILWLSVSSTEAKKNLQNYLIKNGLTPERIIFSERVDDSLLHLRRHQLADIFLDTFPYNAHTTANDALYAGLPVITYAGKSFASRVAGSLLKAVDMEELITYSIEQYEKLAIDLASDPIKLKLIKEKLQVNKKIKPLFDTHLYVKNLEILYIKIYDQYIQNNIFDHIRSKI